MKKLLSLLPLLVAVLVNAQTITLTSPNNGEVWNTGKNYTITWTSQLVTNVDIEISANDAPWVNIATNIPSTGSYTWGVNIAPSFNCLMRIKDANNTVITDTNDIRFIIGPIVTVFAGQNVTTCRGVPTQLNAEGIWYNDNGRAGEAPLPPPGLNYKWSPTNGLSADNIANPIATPTATTTYTVTASDENGVSAASSVTVFITRNPGLSIRATNLTANYFVQDTLFPQVAPISQTIDRYYWYEVGKSTDWNWDWSKIFKYNYPGTFWCMATNNYGCTDTASITIGGGVLNVAFDTAFTVDSVSCYEGRGGALKATATGGNPPYFYNWSHQKTTQTVTDLYGGTFTVTVHDGDGNVGVASHAIKQPAPYYLWKVNNIDGTFPDTVSMRVLGGTPPYSYHWFNGATDSFTTVNASGAYTCTVTDAGGCQLFESDTVGVLANDDFYKVVINTTKLIYPTYGNDLLDFFEPNLYPYVAYVSEPQHGTLAENNGGYNYTPANNYAGADSFFYVLCMTDQALVARYYCDTAMVRIEVGEPDLFVASLTVDKNPLCQTSCDGIVRVKVTDETTGPYIYKFSGSEVPASAQGLQLSGICAGNFEVTVTDALGTSTTVSVTLKADSALSIMPMGDGLDSVYVVLDNSAKDWVFNWSTGGEGDINYFNAIPALPSGIYCVTVTNTSIGCVLTACETIACNDCVWPGDANRDQLVDNYDILPIGLGYGKTGFDRFNPTTKWEGQQCNNWADNLDANTNYKHVDCNGDGFIDAQDTTAIVLNFTHTWSRSSGRRMPKEGSPELKVTLSPDTVHAGDIMTATISLGDAQIPAVDVYGLAFTVNYDAAIVDSLQTTVTFGDSWLGTVNEKLAIAKDFNPQGKMKLGVTRMDHTSRDGFGPIGIITFVITTDNINGKDELRYYGIESWISDLVTIDEGGNLLDINEGLDSASVGFTPTGISEGADESSKFNVFPNPTRGQIVVANTSGQQMEEIIITDILGKVVLRQSAVSSSSAVVNVSLLNSGTYYVRIITENGTCVKPIIISE